ncbi:hypothetical protein A9972_22085 [Pseudomonas sp. UME83]|nr:hypothetical protein [Pseudomonas sp. UME83]
MAPRTCCDSSMHSIDNGKGLGDFELTGHRQPIGQKMTFYKCLECGDRWSRTEQTSGIGDIVWHEVS